MTATIGTSAANDAIPTLEPARRLRELLNQPKPKDAEWQEEAARMVSLLAIRFPQETDEAAAFTAVALVGLASAKGVTEAKKRTLKLTRWSSSPPPPLDTLTRPDERRAVLMTLAKLKTPWGKLYADRALVDSQLDASLLPDLLRWSRSSARDWRAFVTDTLAPAVAASDSARAAALLKDAPKVLKLSSAVPAPKVAEALATLMRAATEAVARPEADPKVKVAICHAGFGIGEQAWHALPALLLQPAFVAALGQLAAAAGPKDKSAGAALGSASMATLSLVIDLVQRFGADASQQCRSLLPIWTSTYPDLEKHLKLAAVSQPGLTGLLANESDETVPSGEGYAAEAAFASLLPAWDAFVAGLPDPARAASLTSMLSRAANTAGVEAFGIVGETVDYDPLSHHLSGSGEVAARRVRILRAGVRARRADGSTRTLTPALVEVA